MQQANKYSRTIDCIDLGKVIHACQEDGGLHDLKAHPGVTIGTGSFQTTATMLNKQRAGTRILCTSTRSRYEPL